MAGSANNNAQQKLFAERIKRINSGKTGSPIQVGLAKELQEGAEPAKGPRRRRVGDPPLWLGKVLFPFKAMLVVVLGFVAFPLALYARFRAMGPVDPSENPDVTLAIHAGIAVVILVILGRLFRVRGKAFFLFGLLAIGASSVSLHNAVHLQPSVFQAMFSSEWVGGVLATTQPETLTFRGAAMPLPFEFPAPVETQPNAMTIEPAALSQPD